LVHDDFLGFCFEVDSADNGEPELEFLLNFWRFHSMLKKCLALAAFAFCAAPLFADVILQTSINDVFNRGSSELAGSITMTVDDDDFTNASTMEPVFIRVTPDHNSRLADTLVDQNLPLLDYRRDPIFLAMELITTGPTTVLEINSLPETVSIVRWVAGESAFWIRVQSDSDNWVVNNITGSVFGPNDDAQISWTLGISARSSDADNDTSTGKSNLPFNTRDPLATEGDFDLATSTLLCVDLSSSVLETTGIESILQYDIISFDSNADLMNGFYSGNAGNPTGIDFSNDFRIARGKSRQCTVTVNSIKGAPADTLLCVPAAASNQSLDGFVKATNVISFTIRCARGGSLLDTDLFNGAYVTFSTGNRGAYGFLPGAAQYGSVNSLGVFSPLGNDGIVVFPAGSNFVSHGQTLYNTLNLIWNDGQKQLDSFTIAIRVCTWYYFSDPPINALLDWSVVLVNHDGAEDTFPYEGVDQHRRCEPSEFVIYEDVWDFANYVPCFGTPAVIFFPYAPKLFDTNFWVGLVYVNQGGVDFADDNIETIFYMENGDRFVGLMPGLPVRNQMTWLLTEDELGTVGLEGVGVNNDGEFIIPAPTDPAVDPSSFGTTRMSLFVRGTFEAEFLNNVYDGDLDGYLLVGDKVTASVDGAYLPRNYDNDIPNQNADLPIWRSKVADSGRNLPIESDSPAKYRFRGNKLAGN
jgi:hypothetical protein